MMWGKARKKPVVVEFREVQCSENQLGEWIETREGKLIGYKDQDLIIRGVEGELYPIKKNIFEKTYDVIESIDSDSLRSNTSEETKNVE